MVFLHLLLRMIPQKIGNHVYYVQRSRRTIRELGYNYNLDEYAANDAALLSEHITGEGVVDMAYQHAPYSILWCVTTDGYLALMTRQIEQEVKGWSKVITDGSFESVAVIAGEPPA